MTSDLEKREPEIACQQILETDASVYSVQCLDLPVRCTQPVSAALLLERYFKVVRECTCHLIRPTRTPAGIEFRLLATSFALLRFSPPQFAAEKGREAVHLCISGGFMVQAGECNRGRFSLILAPGEAGVRITVQLSDYCPLLLGSRTPSKMRRFLYRLTQAYFHKVVTVRFLCRLYRELTGVKKRVRVVKVPAGEEA